MVVSFGQAIYTPTDHTRADLIEDDRPYAAALMASFGYNARTGDRLRTTQLRVGIVGPSAQAKQVQHGRHTRIGTEPVEGQDNQFHDEPVFPPAHRPPRQQKPPER